MAEAGGEIPQNPQETKIPEVDITSHHSPIDNDIFTAAPPTETVTPTPTPTPTVTSTESPTVTSTATATKTNIPQTAETTTPNPEAHGLKKLAVRAVKLVRSFHRVPRNQSTNQEPEPEATPSA